jgi:hypothetical protein
MPSSRGAGARWCQDPDKVGLDGGIRQLAPLGSRACHDHGETLTLAVPLMPAASKMLADMV